MRRKDSESSANLVRYIVRYMVRYMMRYIVHCIVRYLVHYMVRYMVHYIHDCERSAHRSLWHSSVGCRPAVEQS